MIVENAKNSRQTATNMAPKLPKPVAKAAWASAVPVRPSVPRSPEERMTRAVMLRTMKVSIKTPTIAVSP